MNASSPALSAKPRFAFLDYGRVVACVMVVLFHAAGTASKDKYFGPHALSDVMALGFVRMPFFFAMSGFLLSWFYLRPGGQRVGAGEFFAKRASRLFPMYWIVLLLVAAAEIFVLKRHGEIPEGWDWWAMVLLVPRDVTVVGGTGAALLYPAWVLQYELVGYLLIAAAVASQRARLAYLYGFPVFYVLFADSPVFALRFLGSDWLLIFWLGAVAACAARTWSAERLRAVLRLSLASLVAAMVLHWAGGDEEAVTGWKSWVNMDLAYGICFALLMAGMLNHSRAAPAAAEPGAMSRWVTRMALWSYAIFLLHAPVITFVCRFLVKAGVSNEVGWPLAVMLSLVVSVVAGAVAERLIEAPVDRLIGRAWRWFKTGRAAAASAR